MAGGAVKGCIKEQPHNTYEKLAPNCCCFKAKIMNG